MSRQAGDMRVELLGAGHDRSAFRSGVKVLDQYLSGQARRDVARAMSAVFVMATPERKAERSWPAPSNSTRMSPACRLMPARSQGGLA
jgi:hypothetical protein